MAESAFDRHISFSDHDPHAERLLDAAKAAFLTHGFAAASMDQVARRAQASKTTLYSRFGSKEALFIAVVRRECARSGMAFSPEDFDDLPLDAALRDIGERFLCLLWSPESLRVHQVVAGEAARSPDVARLFYEAAAVPARAAVTGYFARAIECGVLPADSDAAFLSGQFLANLQGGPHCALSLGVGEPPTDPERRLHVARAVRLFIYGCRPAA